MSRLTYSSTDCITVDDPFLADERSWISLHCFRKGFDFYCRVPDEFIEDNFNVTGLSEIVPHYEHAIRFVLSGKYNANVGLTAMAVERSANILYGLIHARYAMTAEGIAIVRSKYLNREYGVCPRAFCKGARVLPIGLSDKMEVASVKVFCPQCNDVYESKASRNDHLDGAFFGTGLPHMMFMMYPELRPLPLANQFEARLFGFKLHNFETQKNKCKTSEN